MKRTIILIGTLAASALLFSCSKNSTTPAPAAVSEETERTLQDLDPDVYLLSFGGNFEKQAPAQEEADTKVVVTPDTGVQSFEDGDEVLVYVPAVSAKGLYVYDATEEQFSPKTVDDAVAVGDNYAYAYYPAGEFSVEGDKVSFTMPAAVTELPGKKTPLGGILPAGASEATFKNLGSILRFSFSATRDNGETLTAVELSGEGVNITGKGSVTWSENTAGGIPQLSDLDGDNSLTLTLAAPLRLTTAPADVFFFLPPGGELANLTVKAIYGKDGGYAPFEGFRRANAMTLGRGNIVKVEIALSGFFGGGDGSAEHPYVIASADDFKAIATLANATSAAGGNGYDAEAGRTFFGSEGVHYQQTADIDFENADISDYMIGGAELPFAGTYDGDNKTLSNFTITGAANYTGLWRYADGATFSNIRIQGAKLTSSKDDTGIIAGRADNSTISNCTATTTTVTGSTQRTGGLFGMVEGGSLTGCVFGAETAGASDGSSVTGNGNTGGLVGICNSNMTDCSNIKATVNGGSGTANGGVAGSVRAAVTLTNCTNSGNVSASKDYNGGVVGYATVAACTLDGCSNSGNVTAGTGNKYIGGVVGMINCAGVSISNCTNSGDVSKGYDIGGIVGYVSEDITITECENSGSISAQNTANNSDAGGIVGLVDGANATIILCDNVGSVTATRANTGGIVGEIPGGKIDRCTNQANVKVSAANQNNVGGIGGYVHGTTYIKRCYSSKVTITGGTRVGGIVGNLIDASQVVNCAVFSQIRGARTGAVGTYGIGTIVGCQGGTSLIANCLARDNGVHVQNTGSDTQLAGGIVGWRNAGALQNCYTAGVLNNIRSKSKNGPALGAYVGQICGQSTGGTIKDCYYRGHSSGARDLGTASSDTNTDNITCLSENTTTGYSYGLVPVEVTTSTGTTFAAGTAYLKDLLNAGLTAGGIDGYTPETGEEMTWTDSLLGSGYAGYPVPSALANLGSKFYNE